MTYHKKALEIANKFYKRDVFTNGKEKHLLELEEAKKQGIICVNIIIEELDEEDCDCLKSWNLVKKEINKL